MTVSPLAGKPAPASVLINVAALVTACLPTYRVIGVWAPVLLVLMRVLEGLGAAGEASSSVVLMVEEAQSSRRGRAGSVSCSGNAAGVMELLFDHVRDRGMTLLLVTHDEELAKKYTGRILRMQDGRVV